MSDADIVESLHGINLTEIEDFNVCLGFCIPTTPCCHRCEVKIEGQWRLVENVYGNEIAEILALLGIRVPSHFDYLLETSQ